MDERELIERVRGGDMVAARQLYNAHVDAVHRLALRMTGEPELAQDATQDAFVRAFKSLKSFRGEAAFGTWMHRIAMSAILTALRGRRRWQSRRAEMEEADELIDTTRETEPDLRTRLHAAIDALPEIYRTVFVLHDVEGYKHEEIGNLLGMPAGTSKARLSGARARLRDALREFEGEWANV